MVCLNQFLYPVTDTALNIDRLMEITKAFLNNLQYSKTVGQHLKMRLPRPRWVPALEKRTDRCIKCHLAISALYPLANTLR